MIAGPEAVAASGGNCFLYERASPYYFSMPVSCFPPFKPKPEEARQIWRCGITVSLIPRSRRLLPVHVNNTCVNDFHSFQHRSDDTVISSPTSTRSLAPVSPSPPSSPPRSSSVAAASVEEAIINGATGSDPPEYGDLQLSGFDLQASMESRDIAEVKGHVRLLHDLVRTFVANMME